MWNFRKSILIKFRIVLKALQRKGIWSGFQEIKGLVLLGLYFPRLLPILLTTTAQYWR